MRFTLRLMLFAVVIFFSAPVSGQWLKMIESSDNLYNEAKKEIELKHYQKAINMCNKALDISPKNLDIRLLLGNAFALAGKIDSARLELNYVIQKNPKYRDAYIYLINMESAACNYLQALEYADMGLKYFPNDRDILLKKLDIYIKMGDWIESNKLADYLFDRFSTDPYIRSVYLDYKLAVARQYSHRGYIEIAKRAYEAVLEQDPLNKEALTAIFSLDIRSGNYESSLAYTNRALQSTPNSYEFLMKKVSILDAMSRYVEALEVVERLMKLYPNNSDVLKLNSYIRMTAGRFYMNTDPYLLFSGVLDRDPGNMEALNYTINIAFSRGMLPEALQWINFGLKRSPNDYELLKKKLGILESMKRYGAASSIAEKMFKDNPTSYNKENYLELRTLAAKQYMNDMEYDSAIVALKSVLFYDRSNVAAVNYMISVYSLQKRYDDALRAIDEALVFYPNDENLLFKKAGVLEGYQRYSDAAKISKQLLEAHPENRQYLASLIEQSLAAGRQSMQYDDYYNTLKVLKEVLDKQPDNVDALNYIINIESAIRDFDSAMFYVDQGLRYYPESKDFLFRKSLVYADAKQFRTAYEISGDLFREFPYNGRYRSAYMEQRLGSGREYLDSNNKESALEEFYKALEVSPKDTIPLYYTINLLYDMKQYDTAISLLNRGRRHYPQNAFFLYRKAEVLQAQKKYDEAWRNADTLAKMTLNPKHLDLAALLFSFRMRNEIGLFYLHSRIIDASNLPKINSIATVQYSRFFNRGVLNFRVNYAGRITGTGFQFEAETYYNHSKKWYSYAIASYSPDITIFPQVKLGYSINRGFNKGYSGELGIRYLQLSGGTLISPVAGISKEIKDFFLNFKFYYQDLNFNDTIRNTYYSGIFTARYYLRDNRTEFFSAMAGYGNVPDDFSTNYFLSQVASFNTVSCGVGYRRQIYYLTTFGINAAWYNIKTNETIFRNQYDIYVSLQRRF
ncbi:MAG: tetratricopeptide repeat protein [Taibaiella sp.]|nr:tetratricopeptide repeat protein [Taibaiella sp.]